MTDGKISREGILAAILPLSVSFAVHSLALQAHSQSAAVAIVFAKQLT
jgi:hypothetical protein